MRESTEAGLGFLPSARRVVRFGPFRADLSDGSLWRGDEEVRLPPRALALLIYLLERPGRVVSKAELIDAVWKEANVSETSLTEALGIVRQTLGDSSQQPQYIQTVHRRGYRFIETVSIDAPSTGPRGLATAAEPVSTPAAVLPNARRLRPAIVALALAGIMAAAGSVWVLGMLRRPEPVTRATISLPASQAPPIALSLYPIVALSPDGQDMIYVARSSNANQLFIRRMNQFDARAIPGTEGAHAPFFSPDGRRVAFFSGRKVKHVALAGGEVVTVSDAQGGLGGAWTSNGTIIFAPNWTGGLLEVDERGGTPRSIADEPGKGFGYRWPQVLPDGETIIATEWRADEPTATIVALSRSTGAKTVLVRGASSASHLQDHLVYGRGGNLFVARFTPGGHPGPERQVLDGVMVAMTGVSQYSVSASGSLVYVPVDDGRHNRRLFTVDRNGQSQPLDHEPRAFQEISVCNDRLAASILWRGAFDVWIGRLSGGALTRLTHTGSAMDPIWRPGCEEVAYSSSNELHLQRADGSSPSLRLTESSFQQAPTSWSPDGSRLMYVEVRPDTRPDIWMLNVADRSRISVLATPAVEWYARVSPDGRWLAYQSNETGRHEVYVRPFQRAGGRTQVSATGGVEPSWSEDGRSLYYVRPKDHALVAIDLDPSTGAPAPVARTIFERPDMAAYIGLSGDRFLVADRIREHLPITTMNLVVNWAAEILK